MTAGSDERNGLFHITNVIPKPRAFTSGARALAHSANTFAVFGETTNRIIGVYPPGRATTQWTMRGVKTLCALVLSRLEDPACHPQRRYEYVGRMREKRRLISFNQMSEPGQREC